MKQLDEWQGVRYFHPDPLQYRTACESLHVKSWRDTNEDVFGREWIANEMPGALRQYWDGLMSSFASDHNSVRMFVALQDDALIAFGVAQVDFDPSVGYERGAYYIANLHVEPALRSKRVGERLMRLMADDSIKLGQSYLHLSHLTAHDYAHRFYSRVLPKATVTTHRTSAFGLHDIETTHFRCSVDGL